MAFNLQKHIFEPFEAAMDDLREKAWTADAESVVILGQPNESWANDVERIRILARRHAFRFRNEAHLHLLLAEMMTGIGLTFVHEARDGTGRYDFLLASGLVLEVKVDGSLTEALRQADRYLARESVAAVLILGTPAWAQNFGWDNVREKPLLVQHLQRHAF